MDPNGPARADATGAPGGTPRWRRVVAFVATLFFPGISQADDGEFRRGFLWFVGLACLQIAGLLILYATLDRPRLSLGAAAAVVVIALGLVLRLAVDGYRRERTPGRRGPAKRVVAIYAAFVAASAALALARGPIRNHLVTAYRFPSISMEPTLSVGDHLLVDRSAYARDRRPKAGDVAVFIFPEDRKKVFLKRVVAVPGDVVEIRHKRLRINGSEVREEYARMAVGEESFPPQRDNMKPVRLPDGKYFVLGDNRDKSYDSRFFGAIDGKDFLGKAACIYYSPDLRRIGTAIR